MSDPAGLAKRVIANVERAIVGKRQQLILSLVSWLCEGHILLEDVPGVAKTMLARALARSVGCSFKRIQCTPDLLPTDVTGRRSSTRRRLSSSSARDQFLPRFSSPTKSTARLRERRPPFWKPWPKAASPSMAPATDL